jgi:hypothetical protein
MDASAILNTLVSKQSLSGIGKAAGTSTANVSNVLQAALPSLLQGASTQANTASTASGFAEALSSHSKDDTSNVSSFLKHVDMEDGAKIISHLLTAKQTSQIAKDSGVDKATTTNILSAVAPLFMSILGQQTSGNSGNALGAILGSLTQNINVTSLLGSLLGAGSSSNKPSSHKPSSSQSNSGKTGSLLSGLMGLLK